MKIRSHLLAFLLPVFLLLSCKSNETEETVDPVSNWDRYDAPVLARDHSIDSTNAINPYFADSAQVENFIAANNLEAGLAQSLRNFYNARNYQYAWYTDSGFTEHTRLFWNQYDYETTHNKRYNRTFYDTFKKMSTTEDTILMKASDSTIFNNEMNLTVQYVHFLVDMYGADHLNEKMLQRFAPLKKDEPLRVADSLLAAQTAIDRGKADLPTNTMYRKLLKKLRLYDSIAYAGGYQSLAFSGALKKGDSGAIVVALKKRMSATGEYPLADTSALFTDTLEFYVKDYQSRMGVKADGVVGKEFVEELNVPIPTRLEQLLINMNRMLWMPEQPKGRLLEVNIPAFELVAREGNAEPLRMDVVVGANANRTKIFSGDISQVVFAPYWNIPTSIVKNEILPKLESDPGYLERNDMEIVKEGEIPAMRQKPGPKNSLGRVKFLFPNSFDIYLHDTPFKGAFGSEDRAMSHGCIRVKEPAKLANYILQGQGEWDDSRIATAMSGTSEEFVEVKTPLPVFITYYTAWVDDNGGIHFRNDVYGHDKQLRDRMFLKEVAALPTAADRARKDSLAKASRLK